MKNILIINDQKGLAELCRKTFPSNRYRLLVVGERETLWKDVLVFEPDVILLALGTDPAAIGWDMLLDIKIQDPALPVVLLIDPDKGLLDPRLSQADDYVITDCFAGEDLKEKTSRLFEQEGTA